MSKKMKKKTKGTIIILVLIVVVVIVLIIGNNLRQTSQKKKELQESVETVEKIDINKADIETLSKLPGIGAVKSQAIVDYREKIGEFKSLIELTKVKGIGRKTLAKLLPYLEMIGDSAEVKAFLADEYKKTTPVKKEIEIIHKININKASLSELKTLSGIGEKKAQAIIEYRETIGKFRSIDEIKNVKGIGEGIYQKIKDKIIVSD